MNSIFSYVLLFLFLGLALIIGKYVSGLKDSPRELWILFLAKLIEYSAYGASNMAFVLYLSMDCGLDDFRAGSYIGTWSVFMTCASIFIGSVVDAIGIRKTLLVGTIVLLFGRLIMPFTNNLLLVTLFSFIPIALGNALLGPVLSVGIKKYTTGSSTALAFGLFYTMMNIGFALGGYIFDKVRLILGEHTFTVIPILNLTLSTYQFIFLVSFLLTIPTFTLVVFMRDDISLKEDGEIYLELKYKESILIRKIFVSAKKSFMDTILIMKNVFKEKNFWMYLFMLGILVFIKLVFYHFHYTFPKYGIRVLGEGSKVGNLYGILNPIIIIFLVPLIAHFTKNIKSYSMLLVGTTISTISIFISALDASFWTPLMKLEFGKFVLEDWLEILPEKQNPIIFGILAFVVLFSIGEAIWSPRLLQLAAEIAPKGREGTYIALSYLPYFLAKMIAGPLSGWLLSTYAPSGASTFPESFKIWIWIGSISAISPIGLLFFRSYYTKEI
jgi:MFS family permease